MSKGNKKSILNGLNNCWLSPCGRVVMDDPKMDCQVVSFHLELALCIIRKILKLRNTFDVYNKIGPDEPSEYLEDRKWIRLHCFGYYRNDKVQNSARWVISPEQRITKSQEIVIMDWELINKVLVQPL